MKTQATGWRTLDDVAQELQAAPAAVERLVFEGELAAMEVDGALRFHPAVVERFGRRAERHAFLRRWRGRGVIVAAAAAVALAGVVTLAASAPFAGEKVPRQLPYRGYLDQNGAPVTDPAVTMKFDLFTAETGGTADWTEEQTGVSVLEGNFSVALGDLTPIPAALFAQPSLYLAITVNGQALQGRQRLLTVPYAQYASGSNAVPAGTLIPFAGDWLPAGWLWCNGDGYDPAAYPALAAAIGSRYGFDPARSDWPRVPDLRSRVPMGAGQGVGLTSRVLGQTGGEEVHALTEAELAAHAHGASQAAHTHQTALATGAVNDSPWGSGPGTFANMITGYSRGTYYASWVESQTPVVTVSGAGGGGAHNTVPPFLAVNWIIKAVP